VDHERLASIGSLSQLDVDRNGTQEGKPRLAAQGLTPAAAEDGDPFLRVAMAEIGHILNDAADPDVHLFEHVDGAPHISKRYFLRGCYHDHGNTGDGLGDRDGRISRTWRQIHYQAIEVPPHHVIQQLLDGLGDQRSAPDESLFAFHEKAERHDLQPKLLRGQQHPRFGPRSVGKAKHGRNARSIHIRIQQADLQTFPGERKGQVDGHGRLPHAALAAGHGNEPAHFFNAAQGVFREETIQFLPAHYRQLHIDGDGSGNHLHRLLHVLDDALLHGTSKGRQRQIDLHAVFPCADLTDHPQVDDTPFQPRILHCLQRFSDLMLRYHLLSPLSPGSSSPCCAISVRGVRKKRTCR